MRHKYRVERCPGDEIKERERKDMTQGGCKRNEKKTFCAFLLKIFKIYILSSNLSLLYARIIVRTFQST